MFFLFLSIYFSIKSSYFVIGYSASDCLGTQYTSLERSNEQRVFVEFLTKINIPCSPRNSVQGSKSWSAREYYQKSGWADRVVTDSYAAKFSRGDNLESLDVANTDKSGVYICSGSNSEFFHYTSVYDYARIKRTISIYIPTAGCRSEKNDKEFGRWLEDYLLGVLEKEAGRKLKIRITNTCGIERQDITFMLAETGTPEMEKLTLEFYESVGHYIKEYQIRFHISMWFVDTITKKSDKYPEESDDPIFQNLYTYMNETVFTKNYTSKFIPSEFSSYYKARIVREAVPNKRRFCRVGYEPLSLMVLGCGGAEIDLQKTTKNVDKYMYKDRFCAPCPPGFYKPNERFDKCKICPVGSFSDQSASWSCTDCPAGGVATIGKTTLFDGSFSWKNCTTEKSQGLHSLIIKQKSYTLRCSVKTVNEGGFKRFTTLPIEWFYYSDYGKLSSTRNLKNVQVDNDELKFRDIDAKHIQIFKCHKAGRDSNNKAAIFTYTFKFLTFVPLTRVHKQFWTWDVDECSKEEDESQTLLLNTELCINAGYPMNDSCVFQLIHSCKPVKKGLGPVGAIFKISVIWYYIHGKDYSTKGETERLDMLTEIRELYKNVEGRYQTMTSVKHFLPVDEQETCMDGYEPYNDGCKPCEEGTYKNRIGKQVCAKCEKGYYEWRLGSRGCIKCPDTMTTNNKGTKKRENCVPDMNNYRHKLQSLEGASLAMRCMGTRQSGSLLKPRYQWYHLYGDTKIKLLGRTDFLLRLDKAQRKFSGIYICEVTAVNSTNGKESVLEFHRTVLIYEIPNDNKADKSVSPCRNGTEPWLGYCLPCQRGHHRNTAFNHKKCVPCDYYSYQSRIGQSFCTICNSNRFTAQMGSTKSDDCLLASAPDYAKYEAIAKKSKTKQTIQVFKVYGDKEKTEGGILYDKTPNNCNLIKDLSLCANNLDDCGLTCHVQIPISLDGTTENCAHGNQGSKCDTEIKRLSNCYIKKDKCCLTCLERHRKSGNHKGCYGDKKACQTKIFNEMQLCIVSSQGDDICCTTCNMFFNRNEYIWLGDTSRVACIYPVIEEQLKKIEPALAEIDKFTKRYTWSVRRNTSVYQITDDEYGEASFGDRSAVLITDGGQLLFKQINHGMTATYYCDALVAASGNYVERKFTVHVGVMKIAEPRLVKTFNFNVPRGQCIRSDIFDFASTLMKTACIEIEANDFGKCENGVVKSEIDCYIKGSSAKLQINITIGILNRYATVMRNSMDNCQAICREEMIKDLTEHVKDVKSKTFDQKILDSPAKKSSDFKYVNDVMHSGVIYFCESGYVLYEEDKKEKSCRPCPPGTYAFGKTRQKCLPCDDGTYQPNFGYTYCFRCPQDTITDRRGAVNVKECFSWMDY